MYPLRAVLFVVFGFSAFHAGTILRGYVEAPANASPSGPPAEIGTVAAAPKPSNPKAQKKQPVKAAVPRKPGKLEYVDSDRENTCRAFINHYDSNLTVVCSHDFSDAARAKVLVHEPSRKDGIAETEICDFLNTASPMITDCASSTDLMSALRRGELVVAIERSNGRRAAVPIRMQ